MDEELENGQIKILLRIANNLPWYLILVDNIRDYVLNKGKDTWSLVVGGIHWNRHQNPKVKYSLKSCQLNKKDIDKFENFLRYVWKGKDIIQVS